MGTSKSERSDEVPGNEQYFKQIMGIKMSEKSDEVPTEKVFEDMRIHQAGKENSDVKNKPKKKPRLSSARRKFGIKPPRRKKKVPTCTRKKRSFNCGLFVVAIFIMQSCEASPRASVEPETYTLGEDLYLLCISKGSPNTISWMKGKNKTVLTMGNSSQSEKFQTDFWTNNNFSSYSLKIRNFTLNDFGEYFCEFDFLKSNIIKIDYQHFLYKPKSNEISVTVETSQKNVNISIIIEKVFPKPNCTIQAFNWTTDAYMETIERSKFYTMTAYQLLKKEDLPCSFNVTLLCDFRVLLSFSETRQIDNCEGKTVHSTNMEDKTATIDAIFVAIIVAILTAVTLVITCTIGYLRKRKNKCIQIKEREGDTSVFNLLLKSKKKNPGK